MLIEAAMKPITYRHPGGEILIEPGKPVEVEYRRAVKLLEKAGSRVGVVQLSRTDWLEAWRELADITSDIGPDDARLRPVLAALERCDKLYLARKWTEFHKAAMEVRNIAQYVQKEKAQ